MTERHRTCLLYTSNQVTSDVTKYFLFVEKSMQDAARKKLFNDLLLRAQIKAAYEKLADKKYRDVYKRQC